MTVHKKVAKVAINIVDPTSRRKDPLTFPKIEKGTEKKYYLLPKSFDIK